MNQRPSGYEPDELPDCSTPRRKPDSRQQPLYHWYDPCQRVRRFARSPGGAAAWRRSLRVFGVGGTITTIAAIVQRLDPYDPDRVHGFRLPAREVARVTGVLVAMSLAARRRLPGLQPERADIILAGALVLGYLLEQVGARAITVSEADLLWALVLDGTPADPPNLRTR